MLSLRQSPFELLGNLEEQLAATKRVPNAEIYETENNYTVLLELPGADRDTINVKATDRNLEIRAERSASNTNKNNIPLLNEFHSGTWSRSFRFPHS